MMLNEQGSTNQPAVVTIDFHGQQLESWRDDRTEKVYVAMRRLCDNMGLAWSPQRTKIAQSHLFKGSIGVMEIITPGGAEQVLGLDLDMLPAWLLGIHPDKVDADIREDLKRYQQECVQALRNYWFTGVATRPVVAEVTDPILQSMLLTQQQISALVGKTQEALNIAQEARNLAHVALDAQGWMTVRQYLYKYALAVALPPRLAKAYGRYLNRHCYAKGVPIYDKDSPLYGREHEYPEQVIRSTLPRWLARRAAQLDNF